jgi:hypothetical protein
MKIIEPLKNNLIQKLKFVIYMKKLAIKLEADVSKFYLKINYCLRKKKKLYLKKKSFLKLIMMLQYQTQ